MEAEQVMGKTVESFWIALEEDAEEINKQKPN